MSLPQEIIHQIVDFVHDDRRTLATLRLLNRAWNISASLHLFRSIDLPERYFRGDNEGLRIKVFISLLESSTETISHCVRQVILGPERQHPNDYAVLVHSIISRFTHMSDIVFMQIGWSALTPSFSSCIFGICKSPTLERIDFWYCSMPTVSTLLDILQASSNLETLSLIHSRIDALSSSSPSSVNEYCTDITTPLLHSLKVNGASDHLSHVFKVVKSKQLHWNIFHDNVSLGDTEFLKSVGQCLESLVIQLPHTIRLEPGLQLDFSHCARLQHLSISGLRWSPSHCPSNFCSLFAQTADRSLPIERLELMVCPVNPSFISCEDERTYSNLAGLQDSYHPAIYQHQCQPHDDNNHVGNPLSKLCYSGWLAVDDSLSRSRIFQSLKTLEIILLLVNKRNMDMSDVWVYNFVFSLYKGLTAIHFSLTDAFILRLNHLHSILNLQPLRVVFRPLLLKSRLRSALYFYRRLTQILSHRLHRRTMMLDVIRFL